MKLKFCLIWSNLRPSNCSILQHRTINIKFWISSQVVVSLWAAAVIGSWCNILTVIYIGNFFLTTNFRYLDYQVMLNSNHSIHPFALLGFVSAHTLPVLYEKYQDQVDDFLYKVLGLLRSQYQKIDQNVLSKIPKGNLKSKKAD